MNPVRLREPYFRSGGFCHKAVDRPEEDAAARSRPTAHGDVGRKALGVQDHQQEATEAAAARASSSAAAAAAPEEASPSEVRGLCGSAAVSPSSTAVRSITVQPLPRFFA